MVVRWKRSHGINVWREREGGGREVWAKPVRRENRWEGVSESWGERGRRWPTLRFYVVEGKSRCSSVNDLCTGRGILPAALSPAPSLCQQPAHFSSPAASLCYKSSTSHTQSRLLAPFLTVFMTSSLPPCVACCLYFHYYLYLRYYIYAHYINLANYLYRPVPTMFSNFIWLINDIQLASSWLNTGALVQAIARLAAWPVPRSWRFAK